MAKAILARACEFCGVAYSPKLTAQRFCGAPCVRLYTAARRRTAVEKKCEVCGEGFSIQPSGLRKAGRGRFCSMKCLWRGRSPTKLPGPTVDLTCEWCGNRFTVPIYRKNPRFCSRRCLGSAAIKAIGPSIYAARQEQRKQDEPARMARRSALRKKNGRLRAQRVAAVGGNYTRADVERIRVEQGDGCKICGVDLRGRGSRDHVVPIVRGGPNDASNIQLLCKPCNSRKRARLMSELDLSKFRGAVQNGDAREGAPATTSTKE